MALPWLSFPRGVLDQLGLGMPQEKGGPVQDQEGDNRERSPLRRRHQGRVWTYGDLGVLCRVPAGVGEEAYCSRWAA